MMCVTKIPGRTGNGINVPADVARPPQNAAIARRNQSAIDEQG
jgi:hypothetical protein